MEDRKSKEMEGKGQGSATGESRLGNTHSCIFSSINVKPHLGGKEAKNSDAVTGKARGVVTGKSSKDGLGSQLTLLEALTSCGFPGRPWHLPKTIPVLVWSSENKESQ